MANAETPATKSKYFFIIGCVDISMRNLHTQRIGEVCAWVRNQYSKLIFIVFVYFYRSSFVFSLGHFLYSPLFAFLLSLSLFFIQTDPPSNLSFITLARPLMFLGFWKIFRQLVEK
jgi:hypothetical protein